MNGYSAGSGPLGSGPTGPGSGFSVMPFTASEYCPKMRYAETDVVFHTGAVA